MSTPLKPSLATVHPRSPQPRAERSVHCPSCDNKFSISRRAVSVRCPKCTTPLRFEDFNLDTTVHRDVNTMGVVNVTPASEMIGNIKCGQLRNEGKYFGKAKVYGPIVLLPDSITRGELIGQSMNALVGASFEGKAMIGPNFSTLSPPEKIERQQQQVTRRVRVLSPRKKAG